MKKTLSQLLICIFCVLLISACNKKTETDAKQAASATGDDQKLYQLKYDWVANDEEANQKAISDLFAAQSFSIELITLPTSQHKTFQHRVIATSKVSMSMNDFEKFKNSIHQISPNGNVNSFYTVIQPLPLKN
jgi:hypothetical protein